MQTTCTAAGWVRKLLGILGNKNIGTEDAKQMNEDGVQNIAFICNIEYSSIHGSKYSNVPFNN